MSHLAPSQQRRPPPKNFDAGVVWHTLAGLGEGLLRRVPSIRVALVAFAPPGGFVER
jgi:hypothetical protein